MLGYGKAELTVAWHLPLVTLCSPARGEGCSSIGIAVGAIEGEVLSAGETKRRPPS